MTPATEASPLFSPRGEAKCVRRPSVRGARRLARGGVLEQYGEYGNQARRSNGGLITCFGRQVGRVEDGRGCSGRLRRIGPVSRPRSSNRTCGFPASGSPTGFLPQAVAGGGPRCIRRRRTTPDWPNTAWSLHCLVPRDDTVHRLPASLGDKASSAASRSFAAFSDSCQSPDPPLLPKRAGSQGPSLHRSYPASPLLWPCPTSRRVRPPCRGRPSGDLHPPGPPSLRCGLPSLACRAHYPGGPNGCACRLLPGSCGLPRISGGSASAISLSRPAQAYFSLRPASLLARLSPGFVTRLRLGRSPDRAARQLPCLPTTTWVGSSLPQGVRAEKAH